MALPSCLMPMVLISKLIATVLSTIMEGIHHHWLSRIFRLSLRTTKFRDQVELATRIDPTISEDSRVRLICPVLLELLILCMDISKITRKPSKTSKHGHENQKSTKRSQRIKAEARKVRPQSNPGPNLQFPKVFYEARGEEWTAEGRGGASGGAGRGAVTVRGRLDKMYYAISRCCKQKSKWRGGENEGKVYSDSVAGSSKLQGGGALGVEAENKGPNQSSSMDY
ncbi:hypothetical protein Tco_0763767 [Tanacetum coccineum]